jgi:hypothetical protein
MDLEQVVRPAESPRPAQGFRAPSTKGVNPGTGEISFGGDTARNPEPVVRTDQDNNFDNWVQSGTWRVADGEIGTVPVPISGSFQIDTRVPAHWLQPQGSTITLTMSALPSLATEQQGSIYAGARRLRTIQVVLQWADAGTRTVTIDGALWAGGEQPTWTEDAGGIDVIQLQLWSNGTLLAFESGTDMSEVA